jgi:chromosomal replication initiator protein
MISYYAFPGLKTRPKSLRKFVKPEFIIDIVCNHFRCTKEELFRKSRKGHIVFQRHITQYLLMNHSPLGCKAIGDYFGQDHTTVLHAHKSVKKEIDHRFENNYKSHIEELINKMKYES